MYLEQTASSVKKKIKNSFRVQVIRAYGARLSNESCMTILAWKRRQSVFFSLLCYIEKQMMLDMTVQTNKTTVVVNVSIRDVLSFSCGLPSTDIPE